MVGSSSPEWMRTVNLIEQHDDRALHRQLARQKLECRGPAIQWDTRGGRLLGEPIRECLKLVFPGGCLRAAAGR